MLKLYKWAGKNDLWFLAREGYVLKEVYDIFAKNIIKENGNSEYFLTSRRSISVPAIENINDIRGILEQNYDGTFSNLLKARLGLDVNDDFKNIHIIMPRDIEKVMKMVEPHLNDIFEKANAEKKEYMVYINCPKTINGVRSFLPVKGKDNMVVSLLYCFLGMV